MKKILCYSRFLGTNAGGAEISFVQKILEDNKQNEYAFFNSYTKKHRFGDSVKEQKFSEITTLNNIKPFLIISMFPLLEYFMNRSYILNKIDFNSYDEIWVYGFWSPIFAKISDKKNVRFFVRSETDLGIFENYNYGLRFIIKLIHNILELPFKYVYLKDLKKLYLNSEIISNSKYTSKLVYEIFNRESIVEYPKITNDLLLLKQKGGYRGDKITFVGDSRQKGIHVFKCIAAYFRKETFRIFSRTVKKIYRRDNIIYMPWTDLPSDIYIDSKLIIVPSQWKEAFGRVAYEASFLNIDVIVSNIGGLPEAVKYNKDHIVNNFSDPEAWIKKIEEKL